MCAAPCHVAIVAASVLSAGLAALAGAAAPTLADANDSVRGIVKAKAEATISSELVAQILRLPFKTGEFFRKDAPIVEFDCRRYVADIMAATAETRSARLTLDMNRGLRERNAIGAHELAISGAKLDHAEALMQALKVRTEQCVIKAPFNGYVVERLISEHEIPQSNAPLLRVVADGALELGLVVPSQWLVWLRPGRTFRFHVEETGTTHDGRILRIGAVVDPISRTANVEAALNPVADGVGLPADSTNGRVRPGMSGTATFTIPH